MDEEELNKMNDLNKNIIEEVTSKISSDAVVEKVADLDTIMEEVTECMRTPRATLYEQNETPGGSIYWEPHVEGIPIPVKGAYYDTIDEALDMYTKYAEMVGFEIKKEGQRLTKSGAVQHKYIYCNKEGVPKAYFIDSPLYGLMRTTSRSESENSFFKSFTSPGATLVSFMMSYESAMERQRYRKETLDFKTIDAAPKCETNFEIERHAARDLKIDEGCETVIIRDKKPNDNRSLFNKKKEENKRRKLKQ
nr:hypothetical protein [Tanacetum cinerariifolium]